MHGSGGVLKEQNVSISSLPIVSNALEAYSKRGITFASYYSQSSLTALHSSAY